LRGVGGRWSTVAELVSSETSPTERAHARAKTLLGRHGVVTREVNDLEPTAGGFSALYAVFREMEELGKLRRGYFVQGLGGAQFASLGAVDKLRAAPPSGKAAVLAALDPANPYGWLVPWPTRAGNTTPARRVGACVVLIDGAPALYLGAGQKHLTTFAAMDNDEPRKRAVGALEQVARGQRRRSLYIETIDGVRAKQHPLAEAMLDAGYRSAVSGLERDYP